MSANDPIRIFLLDDHEVVRRGLRAVIEAEDDLEVVGEAATAEEALARIPPCRPDVAVLDVRLPDGSGIEVCREVRSTQEGVACLMLSSFSGDEVLLSAVMAGASGYLLKDVHGLDLAESIRRAAAGESLLDPRLTQVVLDRIREGPRVDSRLAGLTPQERQVLDLIGQGMTNRQIAGELHLAETTVKNYVSRLLTKMDLPNRSAAAAYIARLEKGTGGPGVPPPA